MGSVNHERWARGPLLTAVNDRRNRARRTENAAWSQGREVSSSSQGLGWTLLFGRHFVVHDTATAETYFRNQTPKIVERAEQMRAYSHSELLAETVEKKMGFA